MSDCYDPMDCSLPGSSVHGILQARILESAVIAFSRGSSWWGTILCCLVSQQQCCYLTSGQPSTLLAPATPTVCWLKKLTQFPTSWAIMLPRIYLFFFTRQSREAKSRRWKRLPPTTPEKVKEGSTQEQQGWNWSGPFKLSRGKISLFKLQSSLQLSTFTNLMIKGRKKTSKHMKNHLYN